MIINLTQHAASPEQITQGVTDLQGEQRNALVHLLTFSELPDVQEILDRASDIAELACYNGLGDPDGDSPMPHQAMIGGAFWLMAPLAEELKARNIQPVFAFSLRESSEIAMPDGSVRKTLVFRHVGFVDAV